MSRKKILTAIDGSDHSTRVLEKTVEFAGLLDTEVILVYCHRKFPSILGEPYEEAAITSILQDAEKTMQPFRDFLSKRGVEYSERLMEEPAGEVIPNIAAIEQCDMIIMGSRGLTNLEGLIIGSVTHRVLHLASCPVLVVK